MPNISNVIIRVDASFQVGLGHLMRCIEIARQLESTAYKPILVLNCNADTLNLNMELFDIILLSSDSDDELIELSKRLKCRIIFFDVLHRQNIKNLIKINNLLAKLKNEKISLIGFGDYDPLDLKFNIQINPYRKIRLNGFVSGYEYFVISQELLNKQKLKNNLNKKQLLISFGGSDINCVTYKLIEIFKQSKIIEKYWIISVFIGEYFDTEHVNNIKNITQDTENYKIIDGLKLHKEMHKYELGITSGGLTKYELAYLGIPVIIVSQFKDERDRAILYSKEGAAYYLCDLSDLSKNHERIIYNIETILCDEEILEKMGSIGKHLIDGLGAKRVANLIENG